MSTEQDPLREAGFPDPGDILAGKYRVEHVVGAGGMGVVVAATHVQLEERVALKLLKRSVMSPETIARFLREARAAAKIKSDHVARVTDVGTLPGGTPYMVMELLEGEDLSHLVQERGALPVAKAVDYVLQACEAVAEAHALGIVHRDLKPQNLFLARRAGGHKVVKVVDFGISKQMPRDGAQPTEDAAQTQLSSWLGSPYYMSPEQMKSARDVDARTDIWSLGLILYEICTGRLPFEAPSLAELCSLVLHGAPTPLDLWLPDAPTALCSAISRCLQKDREDRYRDVAELALDLAPLAPADARPRVERIVSILRGVPGGPASVAPRAEPTEPVLLLQAKKTPPAPRSGPDSVRVATGERSSTAKDDLTDLADTAPAPPEAARRRPARWLLLILLLGAAGGGGLLLRRAKAWPFITIPAPRDVAADRPAPPVVSATPVSAAPFSVTPAPAAESASPPAPVASVAVAADAGAPGNPGSSIKPPAHRPHASAPEAPAPATPVPPVPPVPPGALRPEVLSETCSVKLPDGTRKQVPCP